MLVKNVIMAACYLLSFHQGHSGKEVPITRSYDCENPENTQCGDGQDRFYELIAVYDSYRVENYPGSKPMFDKNYVHMHVVSFIGGKVFEDDENMLDSALGPKMKIKPEETFSILLRINLMKGTLPASIGDGKVLKMKHFTQLNASNANEACRIMQKKDFCFMDKNNYP